MNDLLGDLNRAGSGRQDGDDYRPRGRPRPAAGTAANPAYNGGAPGRRAPNADVEMGSFQEPVNEADPSIAGMKTFFAAVEVIKADLSQVKALQQEIIKTHETSKTLVKSREVQRSRQEMQDKINEVSGLAHRVKTKLEALDKENEAAKKVKGQGEGSASERTRTSITAGLKKKLKESMGEFSGLRNRIQDEYREVVERRMYTVTGQHVAEDDIDRMIESGEAENIFQKAILTDQQGRGRVLDTLAEIQERHRAVKDLEQSLLELHQIFLDMAVLVETQGEQLDNIEKQVARSVDYVQSGTVALQDAKQLQKKTRKLMCCALIIVLIVALIIVLAVVQPWKFTR